MFETPSEQVYTRDLSRSQSPRSPWSVETTRRRPKGSRALGTRLKRDLKSHGERALFSTEAFLIMEIKRAKPPRRREASAGNIQHCSRTRDKNRKVVNGRFTTDCVCSFSNFRPLDQRNIDCTFNYPFVA